MEEKFCKNHPDRSARIAKSGRSMGLCDECVVAARRKGAKNRAARKGGKVGRKKRGRKSPVTVKLEQLRRSAKPTSGSAGRLVLADTYTCPKCAAQLMIQE